jgi:hypothetical protein
MWNAYRKQRILSGRELLRVSRPDEKQIIQLQRIIWILGIIILSSTAFLNRSQLSAHPIFYLVFILTPLSLFFLISKVALNNTPIIFTEEGIMQEWNKALLWTEIEGYLWMPVGKNYSLLRIFPSNSMPIFWQIDNIKGGFGAIHSDSKKAIEELLQSKGIKYEG